MEMLYDGFHKIEKVGEHNGKPLEKLHLKSAVACVCITGEQEDSRILLVRQHRPAIGMDTWEIPAGVLDKPELSPKQVMIEELYEECGIKAKDIRGLYPLQKYFSVPGSSDAEIQIFRAFVDDFEHREIQNDDVLEARWFKLDELDSIAYAIVDAKTIIAINYFKLSLVRLIVNSVSRVANPFI